eukprot:TCONS_00009403-protein
MRQEIKMADPLRHIYQEGINKLRSNPNAYFYYESGADYEQTLADNEYAYKRYKVYPHLLKNDSRKTRQDDIDLSVNAFGEDFDIPIFLAPTAMQKMAHTDGEVGTAGAAVSKGTCMGVSTLSTTSYENLRQIVPHCTYLMQLYVTKDASLSNALIKKAESAGFKGVLFTVDAPILGQRIADVKSKFHLPRHLSLENFNGVIEHVDEGLMKYISDNTSSALCWDDVKKIRSITNMPIYLKGIITHEDAEKCLEHDVQGIIVSNHGGRQLDGTPATIDVLSEIVRAVGHRIPVYVDGGIRRGSDVFKALALGARGVFIGRPVLYGLSYDGEEGVKEILDHMIHELKSLMRLTGCRSIKDINSSLVFHESKFGIHTKTKAIRHWAITPDIPVCIADIKEGAKQTGFHINEKRESTFEEAFERLRFRPRRLRGLPPYETMKRLMPICLLHDQNTTDILNKVDVREPCFLKIDCITKFDYNSLNTKKYNGLVVDLSLDNLEKIKELKLRTGLPVLATGVTSRHDTLQCLRYQLDGIVVSTKNCEDQLTPIEILPEIAETIRCRIPIYFEGGIRKGTDIVKALARGASFVFVKEPLLWAHSYKGSEGVSKVLDILNEEFQRAMYLAGCKDVETIKPSLVVDEQYFYDNLNGRNISKI